jgi:hypothetical protein
MVVVAVEGINTWCMLSLNCFKMAKLLETYPGFIWVCREMGTLMLMEVEFFGGHLVIHLIRKCTSLLEFHPKDIFRNLKV